MGGIQRGERASFLAVRRLAALLNDAPRRGMKDAIERYACETSDLICHDARKSRAENEGTTLAMLAFLKDAAYVANVGDSRVYRLRGRALERLTQVCTRPLYVDPVSTAWARELKPFIGFFDTVKPNRMELEALTDCPADTPAHLELACDILRGKGVRRVFVSLGREGMFYKGPEGAISRVSRPFDGMVNATGAGDASMAGIVYATRRGLDVEQTVLCAMAAGMVAIASPDTISRRMSPAAIKTMIKEYLT